MIGAAGKAGMSMRKMDVHFEKLQAPSEETVRKGYGWREREM